jgi:hypothetical protein
MYFDKFDICEAYYLFARHYHRGGDTSDSIFGRLCRMRFKPGLSLSQHEEPEKALTENGVEIYKHLTINHPDARGTK